METESDEIKGWVEIAREADVGTDDTAQARAKDRDLPLPVRHRGRRVFARRAELEYWKALYEYLTGVRRMRAETVELLDGCSDASFAADLHEQLKELQAFEQSILANARRVVTFV